MSEQEAVEKGDDESEADEPDVDEEASGEEPSADAEADAEAETEENDGDGDAETDQDDATDDTAEDGDAETVDEADDDEADDEAVEDEGDTGGDGADADEDEGEHVETGDAPETEDDVTEDDETEDDAVDDAAAEEETATEAGDQDADAGSEGKSAVRSFLERGLYFVLIGWWATGIWISLVALANLMIVGIPLSRRMIEAIPGIATRNPEGLPVRARGDAAEEGPSIPTRTLYFLTVGWWLNLLWLTLAYVLTLSVIGLPVARWMYAGHPYIATLYRA